MGPHLTSPHLTEPSQAKPSQADIWATEADWKGIRAFHQLYMPTNSALRRAVHAIRRLDPPVEVIAPQHGRVIQEDLVEEFLGRLEELPVGLDIIDDDARDLDGWNTVLTRVLEVGTMLLGASAVRLLKTHPSLNDTLEIQNGRPRMTGPGRWTLGRVVVALTQGELTSLWGAVKLEALSGAEDLGLPTPDISLVEESPRTASGQNGGLF